MALFFNGTTILVAIIKIICWGCRNMFCEWMTPTNKYLLCRQLYIFSISKRRFFYYYSVTHMVNNDDYFIKVGQYKLYKKKKKNIHILLYSVQILSPRVQLPNKGILKQNAENMSRVQRDNEMYTRQNSYWYAKLLELKKNPRLLNDDTLLAWVLPSFKRRFSI